MTIDRMPAAEVDIDGPLVRALLSEQHPDLAGLPLTNVGSGWDNRTYRLGEGLAVRLPLSDGRGSPDRARATLATRTCPTVAVADSGARPRWPAWLRVSLVVERDTVADRRKRGDRTAA